MSDMLQTIVPKSDQLNADDLIGGRTLTITITRVQVGGGPEQPVSIHYDGGLPYRPCKSMRRVLVHAWGNDSKSYVGRLLTLYTDPKVKYGGVEVGGLRISHMSHIDAPMTVALTATKAKRTPYTVQPIPGYKAEPKAKPVEQPARDWAKEIQGAATLADLGKVWTSIPKAEQKLHLAAKDARKVELQDRQDAEEALSRPRGSLIGDEQQLPD